MTRLILALLLLSTALSAQGLRGAKVHIEEMPLDLHLYLKAEIIKKQVPVLIVQTPEQAEYVLRGTATGSEKNKWHEGWLTASKDKVTGAVEIVSRDGILVWATEAGDRSLNWGSFRRGGPRKVADRIAKSLRKAIRKGLTVPTL